MGPQSLFHVGSKVKVHLIFKKGIKTMNPNENINLDSWRINRAKARREEDLFIDQLCDMLLQLQNKVRELENNLTYFKDKEVKE